MHFCIKQLRSEAGEQHALAGTEKISDAELAKRRGEPPLKPKTAQKPADENLFSEQNNLFSEQNNLFSEQNKQTDLVDQLTAEAAKPEA